jgi:hypothetical protein
VTAEIQAHASVDDATTEAFVASLQHFAGQLSPSETAILTAVLYDAMGPWQRLASRPAGELLSPDEAALVERLANETAG